MKCDDSKRRSDCEGRTSDSGARAFLNGVPHWPPRVAAVVLEMKEPPADRRIESLHPEAQRRVRVFLIECQRTSLRVIVTETLRSRARQAWLYAQGRTRPGKVVTNAPPGSSKHEMGRAVDVAFVAANGTVTWDGPWGKLGVAGESAGLSWGGRWRRFKDYPHFELPMEVP